MSIPNVQAGTYADDTFPDGSGDFITFLNTIIAAVNTNTTGVAAALVKSSNLSDLTSAATARTNLGLGTAATKDTGTGSGNVILGNDSRLTDARTPTAHASSHASAGSDPITIAQSQVTNLATDLAALAPLAGATFTGAVITTASTTGGAGLRLPHGTAPTSPTNGDVWTTTSGVLARINGNTRTLATTTDLASYALIASTNTFTRQQFIDGSADEVQLRVQGTSGQSANLQAWENSAASILASISAAGLATFAGVTSTANMSVSAAAGSDRGLTLATSGTARWMLVETSGSESGANAGSNFRLDRYSDAGSLLSSPISINRATGRTDWVGSTQVSGLETSVPALSTVAPASMAVDIARWLNSAGSTYAKFGIPANNYTPSSTSGTGDLALIQLATYGADVGSNISLAGRYDSGGTRANFASIFAAKENATDGNSAGYLAFYTNSGSTFAEAVRINSSGCLVTKATATGSAGLRIPSGTAPTSPVAGDLYFDGTNLKFYTGSATKTITWS